MPVNYMSMNMQMMKKDDRPLRYPVAASVSNKNCAIAEISVVKNTFIELPTPHQRFMYDVAPPTVFMHATAASAVQPTVTATGNILASTFTTTLKPGESKQFQIVIGLYDKEKFSSATTQVDDFWKVPTRKI